MKRDPDNSCANQAIGNCPRCNAPLCEHHMTLGGYWCVDCEYRFEMSCRWIWKASAAVTVLVIAAFTIALISAIPPLLEFVNLWKLCGYIGLSVVITGMMSKGLRAVLRRIMRNRFAHTAKRQEPAVAASCSYGRIA